MDRTNDDERKFLLELGKQIGKFICKYFDKHGAERAYYEFVVVCHVLDNDFQKVREVVLFNDSESGYCIFCRGLTYYYDTQFSGYLCAECYKKLKGGKNEKE
ncbi:MAG TPA: hypothetical protein P5140_05665 [Methanofastidiosum sp.]|nr:hypothetical protein [Methanofastidiosum sp.]